jgi:hypothetical protein
MPRLFAVLRTRGPAWDPTRPMEAQQDWEPHAAFITALHDQGCVLLVGPLEDAPHALLIVRADSADEVAHRLADDPWSASGHLKTTLLAPWTLRLGAIDAAQRR